MVWMFLNDVSLVVSNPCGGFCEVLHLSMGNPFNGFS